MSLRFDGKSSSPCVVFMLGQIPERQTKEQGQTKEGAVYLTLYLCV